MINVEIFLSNNIGSSISQNYKSSPNDVFGRISVKFPFFLTHKTLRVLHKLSEMDLNLHPELLSILGT